MISINRATWCLGVVLAAMITGIAAANWGWRVAVMVPAAHRITGDLCRRHLSGIALLGACAGPQATDCGDAHCRRCCSYDHVLVSPTGGSFEGPTDEALARSRRRRTVRYSVPSFLLVPELLQIDDLIALVPSRLLRGTASG